MKTVYIDCTMGAAGDMLTAALISLTENPEKALDELNSFNIPNVKYELNTAEKLGVCGKQISVKINGTEEGEEGNHRSHHQHGTGMHKISHIISHLNVSDKVKADAIKVYEIIAQAESLAHGVSVDMVHFHEVGAMDAVADVTAVCYLFDKIGAEKIISSKVHLGFGTVKCAHGILPVPAPATKNILEGIPTQAGDVKGELCTPTGAALIKYFVSEYGEKPNLKEEKTGVGMGKKDFEKPNCLKVYFGESE